VLAEDHDVDTAILGSSLRSVVARNGVIFGVSGGRQPLGWKAVPQDE
jgi:hypothetical protein